MPLLEIPVEFTEDFKWPGANRTIVFSAASYQRWVSAALPAAAELPILDRRRVRIVDKAVKIGRFLFYRLKLPVHECASPGFFLSPRKMRATLPVYHGRSKAHVAFSATVGIPVLACKDLQPWMSLTPNEILTQRGQIRRACGNVGLAGLGLGWAARKILARKSVSHLTVYEKDPEILQFFGDELRESFPGRVTLVNTDAYDVDWLRHDVGLWDIWQGYGDASDDRRFWQIKQACRAAGRVCIGWGEGVWPQ